MRQETARFGTIVLRSVVGIDRIGQGLAVPGPILRLANVHKTFDAGVKLFAGPPDRISIRTPVSAPSATARAGRRCCLCAT
ncbi:hypothetical protein [Actinoplanes sp. ATCC 53533]|uniref:hypothetical protein n=1 Tax=Actinoplanes sp. ATCC 53533 TaxID=1288362 RepID=UPI000F7861F4|nr:hypothetical protein [Actinoplanes sp. ATCC 53533]